MAPLSAARPAGRRFIISIDAYESWRRKSSLIFIHLTAAAVHCRNSVFWPRKLSPDVRWCIVRYVRCVHSLIHSCNVTVYVRFICLSKYGDGSTTAVEGAECEIGRVTGSSADKGFCVEKGGKRRKKRKRKRGRRNLRSFGSEVWTERQGEGGRGERPRLI